LPRIVSSFKCKECDDIFEATSDDFSKCKCGKCCVKPSMYSTTYKNDNGKGCNFERLHDKIYRFKEEYTELSPEFYELWDKIKEVKENREFQSPTMFIYDRQDKSEDGDVFTSSLTAEIYTTNRYHESTSLKFSVDLTQKHDSNEVFERLKKFYGILQNIINNELELNDRVAMKEVVDDWHKRQIEAYDYDFYV